MIDFRSDNVCPPAPQLLDQLRRVLDKGASAYGEDETTQATKAKLCEIFERDLEYFPIFTGTAANALAIAQLSDQFGEVICHESSHVYLDECGAVEFHSHARLRPISGNNGKLTPESLPALADSGDVHRGRATVLSLSQITETGLVYRPDEISGLTTVAREAGLRVHMDGTRFANAVASTGKSPADLSWRAGVDVLCLGATKGGAIGAEAVIFFSPDDARDFRRMMKRSGHLGARMWFLSAQISAWLEDDFWIHAAEHSNSMAALLSRELSERGIVPIYMVEGSMVFVGMSADQSQLLTEMGFLHYLIEQPTSSLAARFVMSHGTVAADVKTLALAIARCLEHSA